MGIYLHIVSLPAQGDGCREPSDACSYDQDFELQLLGRCVIHGGVVYWGVRCAS